MHNNDLIRMVWTGQHLEPDGNYATAQLHDRLGAGEVRLVDIDPQRSKKSHGHQFAFIRTAWENLPEAMKDAPFAKNTDTLRKHALIATGFCETTMATVGDEQQAEFVAAQMGTLARRLNGYAVAQADGPVVYCHTPLSQSEKAMGKAEFQRSKQAILEWMADLIGVDPEELARMGKKEAA